MYCISMWMEFIRKRGWKREKEKKMRKKKIIAKRRRVNAS